MRRIRSADTRPEMVVRRLVHGMGFRYRLHVKTLPGKPDLVFAGRRCVIEVRGCFWHLHEGCREGRIPESRKEYWGPKLERNRARDRANVRELKELGWRVLVIWECEVGGVLKLESRIRRFLGS
jgi:DNA mismatch endonuclease (patch repair protein)